MNALPKTQTNAARASQHKQHQRKIYRLKPKQAAAFARLPLPEPLTDPDIRRLAELPPTILAENFSVEELAGRLKVSYYSFRHRFKTVTGVSLWAYVKWQRQETARELLEQEQLTVKQVMERVGLRDLENFRRDFRAAYGMAPREYRARAGQRRGGA